MILKSKMRLLPQSALFLFSVAALQLPAQTKPEAPQAPVTVEPGLYRPGFGGCRLEDLVLVTEDGCEIFTTYPYDLEP